MNQYSRWLSELNEGDRAVAPCVSYEVARNVLNLTAVQQRLAVVNPQNISISVPGRGSIDFIGSNIEILRGKTWTYAFPLAGDPGEQPNFYKDRFMEILSSRIRPKVV